MMRSFILCSALMLDMAVAQSTVTSFWFSNLCDYDIEVKDWDATIPPGQDWNIYWKRGGGAPYERISYRFKGDTAWDFIETNGPFFGQGFDTSTEHWSFSTYNGFNMGSMYEAWDPTEKKYACSDPGAIVNFDKAWTGNGIHTTEPDGIQCTRGTGYACQGTNACDTTISNFMKDHSWVINYDFSWSRLYNYGTANGRAGNFWCDEKHGFPPSWVYGGVGTLMDCINNKKPFKLVITTCPERRQSMMLNTTASRSENMLNYISSRAWSKTTSNTTASRSDTIVV